MFKINDNEPINNESINSEPINKEPINNMIINKGSFVNTGIFNNEICNKEICNKEIYNNKIFNNEIFNIEKIHEKRFKYFLINEYFNLHVFVNEIHYFSFKKPNIFSFIHGMILKDKVLYKNESYEFYLPGKYKVISCNENILICLCLKDTKRKNGVIKIK
ncbi:hypothetical protein CDIK_1309 [Cucumispora dikerogammari]|nr:hypothetical protein CDIK_1309 [Cucumispora dikerogammari]